MKIVNILGTNYNIKFVDEFPDYLNVAGENWIFLWLEITNPEIWKSEFRYSEIVFFVLDYVSISMGIFVKALPHLRCVAAFTNIPVEIMIQYTQKWI